MHVVFLYGPPGVGTLTIGSELARLTGFKLFHNHLSINLVSAVFERDSEVYVQLRRIRQDVLVDAAGNHFAANECRSSTPAGLCFKH